MMGRRTVSILPRYHFHAALPSASALDKAEYWSVNPYVVKAPPKGTGFDTALTDGLRVAICDVIGNASQPDERPLTMTGLAKRLEPEGFDVQWCFVQGPEHHVVVYHGREQRIARLGHPSNPRSWFGRSRARVATGISLTGQSDAVHGAGVPGGQAGGHQFHLTSSLLLHWAGLAQGDKQMLDRVGNGRQAFGEELCQITPSSASCLISWGDIPSNSPYT